MLRYSELRSLWTAIGVNWTRLRSPPGPDPLRRGHPELGNEPSAQLRPALSGARFTRTQAPQAYLPCAQSLRPSSPRHPRCTSWSLSHRTRNHRMKAHLQFPAEQVTGSFTRTSVSTASRPTCDPSRAEVQPEVSTATSARRREELNGSSAVPVIERSAGVSRMAQRSRTKHDGRLVGDVRVRVVHVSGWWVSRPRPGRAPRCARSWIDRCWSARRSNSIGVAGAPVLHVRWGEGLGIRVPCPPVEVTHDNARRLAA